MAHLADHGNQHGEKHIPEVPAAIDLHPLKFFIRNRNLGRRPLEKGKPCIGLSDIHSCIRQGYFCFDLLIIEVAKPLVLGKQELRIRPLRAAPAFPPAAWHRRRRMSFCRARSLYGGNLDKTYCFPPLSQHVPQHIIGHQLRHSLLIQLTIQQHHGRRHAGAVRIAVTGKIHSCWPAINPVVGICH